MKFVFPIDKTIANGLLNISFQFYWKKLGLSSLILYSTGKRLLNYRRQKSPRSLGITNTKSWVSVRKNHSMQKVGTHPLALLHNIQSKTFNILGTAALAMSGFVLLAMQPDTQVVQASSAENTLYREYKEISQFPMTKQMQKKELTAQNLEEYTVARNDTVNSICLALGIDCETFKSVNDLAYPYSLRVGQTLLVKR